MEGRKPQECSEAAMGGGTGTLWEAGQRPLLKAEASLTQQFCTALQCAQAHSLLCVSISHAPSCSKPKHMSHTITSESWESPRVKQCTDTQMDESPRYNGEREEARQERINAV